MTRTTKSRRGSCVEMHRTRLHNMTTPDQGPVLEHPVADSGRRCCWCAYDLKGLTTDRCPQCTQPLLELERAKAGGFGRGRSTLWMLNLASVVIIPLMLLIPLDRSIGIGIPSLGGCLRLLLFPIQWVVTLFATIVGLGRMGRGESGVYVLFGTIFPVVVAMLTLMNGGEILNYEGFLFWLIRR